MKSLVGFILFTLFLFSSCKQSSTENLNSGAPHLQPGSCSIGKWTNLSSPINLKISSDFTGDFTNGDLVSGLNPIEQMAKAWNDAVSPNATLFQVPFQSTSSTGSNSLNNFRDSELGIYKSYDWFPNVSSTALAITQFYGIVRSDGSLGTYIELTHADIIINYRDFASSFTMNGNSILNYDIPTVVLHEMGHFLGLCHESYSNSIMAPRYLATQRSLKTFDISKVRALYLNNQNFSSFGHKMSNKLNTTSNSLASPVGAEVKGIVELNANGHCRHFINGKLVMEHD